MSVKDDKGMDRKIEKMSFKKKPAFANHNFLYIGAIGQSINVAIS